MEFKIVTAEQKAASVAADFKRGRYKENGGTRVIDHPSNPRFGFKGFRQHTVNGWYCGTDECLIDAEAVYNDLVNAGTDVAKLGAILAKLMEPTSAIHLLMECCFSCGEYKPWIAVFDNGEAYEQNDCWQLCADCIHEISKLAPKPDQPASVAVARRVA